jgi:Holliday junction resolvase-like predicted endonuclease
MATSHGSKRKGKRGESAAKAFLEQHGWYIANTEIQGLAGDDIFARSPEGQWYAIEVKNTTAYHPKFITQARKQAQLRQGAIASKMAKNPAEAEVMQFLEMDKFTSRNWMVMWHPSGSDIASGAWGVIRRRDGHKQNEFLLPWNGVE